jgi:hypothetical protein
MDGLALAFLGFACVTELPKDVYEIKTQQFAMPIQYEPEDQAKMERVRLFFSEDQGKTWTHRRDFKPSAERVIFTARHDGLYWFALQVVYKDGTSIPDNRDDLDPVMKVYVNTEGKPLIKRKSYEQLQREADQQRKTVDQLQKRIKELEAERKPK